MYIYTHTCRVISESWITVVKLMEKRTTSDYVVKNLSKLDLNVLKDDD